MKYLDANIVYPMFGVSSKRLKQFQETGSSDSKIIDYCLILLKDIDEGKQSIILSDLSVLETIGVASRDIGVQKANLILAAIQNQIHLEVIQTSQFVWITALSLTTTVSIEARDSLHLANAILTDLISQLVTCDKDFEEKATKFLEKDFINFRIPKQAMNWYQISLESKKLIEDKVMNRVSQLQMELVEYK